MTWKKLKRCWTPPPEIAAMTIAERAAWLEKIWRIAHSVRLTPNNQAHRSAPEAGGDRKEKHE